MKIFHERNFYDISVVFGELWKHVEHETFKKLDQTEIAANNDRNLIESFISLTV